MSNAIELTQDVLRPLMNQGDCVVVCYNRAEVWKSRESAERFYMKAARACEGCEAERYMNVLMDLMDGRIVCHDGVTEFLTQPTEYR